MNELTRAMNACASMQASAEQLLPLVYDELRKLAAQRLALEKPGQTLQATALVHEAYARLVTEEVRQSWNSRGHFFAAAAEAMRRILVEAARRKGRLKHGGNRARVHLQCHEPAIENNYDVVLAVDEALTQLAMTHPQEAELVKLRYFAGLTLVEASETVGISPATADRRWRFARAWLMLHLQQQELETPTPASYYLKSHVK
jgi:RNA polymerase sigma factor (TIGR02999 family)